MATQSAGKGDAVVKRKVLITVPAEILDDVDAYCAKFGQTRSTFASIALAEKMKKVERDLEEQKSV